MRRVINKVAVAALGCASRASSLEVAPLVESLAARKVFDRDFIASGTAKFVKLEFDPTYQSAFQQEDHVDHLFGYLTATARAQNGSDFFFSKESATQAVYVSGSSHAAELKVMKRVNSFVASRTKSTQAVSVRSYTSPVEDVVLFSVTLSPFVEVPKKQTIVDTARIGGESFQRRPDDVKAHYQALMDKVWTSTEPVQTIRDGGNGTHIVQLALVADRTTYFAELCALIQETPGAKVTKKFLETFSNGVHIYTLYVTGCDAKTLEARTSWIALLPNRPNNAISTLHQSLLLNAEQTVFAHCLITFAFYFTPPATDEDFSSIKTLLAKDETAGKRLNNLRATLSQEMMSERYTGQLIAEYPALLKALFDDFKAGSTAASRAALRDTITAQLKADGRSAHDQKTFETFLTFNEAVLKHNFGKASKAALAFRLNPAFIGNLDFPRVPHGIFFFVGGNWRGFHVRFTEIARGGVRMILSNASTYKKNKMTVFQENFNLANTQLLKNKDIPEGGSKGTLLVSNRYITKFDEVKCKQLFLQYVDALLDVIIPGTEGVVDNLKREEIIFLGPDENTAGSFPSAGALYSKQRGYKAWKSFTTGKDPDIGGIPHDTYGMTTRSVRQCVEGIYRKLGLNEETLTKFQTGGPDGDLGSNEILRSKEKYIGLADIAAVVHDPSGVNKEELVRLAKARKRLDDFDESKLGPGGFKVLAGENGAVTLPDGATYTSGSALRDTFHLSKYVKCDVFVPCGGRPASVTLQNVHQLIDVDGATGEAMLSGKYEKISRDALRFRVIVEGANLFLTQDARLALERCGVVIIKDATANKGGVTSSSLEVLTGLALSDAEHSQLMSARSADDAPEFYKSIVAEICSRVENNANREFEAIWREHEANPTTPKTLICDALSEKIVVIRTNILKSNVFEDKKFLRYVMLNYTPQTLQKTVPIDTIMERVPANYQHAICAMWLASDYVYKNGSKGNEFDFFQFMQKHYEQAAKV